MAFKRFAVSMAAIAAMCLASTASAQSNPIVQHYRAYVAALERGDVTAATTEAQAALAASEARDGDGGRTAVLALNLANAYVLAGNYEAARPLAERAFALQQTGAQGVSPVMAQVVIVRSRLALNADSPNGVAVANELNALLAADVSALQPADVYAAGAQLGNWGLSHEEWEIGRSGWEIAGAHAAGSPFGEAFGLGRARTNEAVSIIMGELADRRARRMGEDEALAAHELLSEAVRALHPLAQVDSPTIELTVAQQTYSEARAWLMALQSKMVGDGHRIPDTPAEAQGDADGLSELGPVDLSRPRCMMRIIAEPRPSYPNLSQVAGVMVFFRVNAAGEVVHYQIAAHAGSEEFAEAIERVAGRWRVERLAESAPNCRMEASLLQGVRFIAGR